MTTPPYSDTSEHEVYDDDETCWQCGGEGGWNSCMEDTCCALGGEEGCTDPLCRRDCLYCHKSEHHWAKDFEWALANDVINRRGEVLAHNSTSCLSYLKTEPTQ